MNLLQKRANNLRLSCSCAMPLNREHQLLSATAMNVKYDHFIREDEELHPENVVWDNHFA